MDAQRVADKILAEAKAEAQKIESRMRQKLDAEQAKADEELNAYRRQTESLAAAAEEDRKARTLASARMKIAKETTATKRMLLEKVFDKAATAIKNLSDAEYQGLMEKLILAAAETGDGEIVVGRNEKRINADFVNGLNQKYADKQINLRLSDDRGDFEAGFILRRGKMRVNASIEVLMAAAKEKLETELARELFG